MEKGFMFNLRIRRNESIYEKNLFILTQFFHFIQINWFHRNKSSLRFLVPSSKAFIYTKFRTLIFWNCKHESRYARLFYEEIELILRYFAHLQRNLCMLNILILIYIIFKGNFILMYPKSFIKLSFKDKVIQPKIDFIRIKFYILSLHAE